MTSDVLGKRDHKSAAEDAIMTSYDIIHDDQQHSNTRCPAIWVKGSEKGPSAYYKNLEHQS